MERSAMTQAARGAGFVLPTLITAIAVLLSVLPYGAAGGLPLAPMFGLVAVFYWSAYTPEGFPLFVAFAAGLLQDLLSGAPLGMMALVYLLVAAVVRETRAFFIGQEMRGGLPELSAFALTALGTAVLVWIIGSFYYDRGLSLWPVLFQSGLTLVLYLPLARSLSWLRRSLPSA